MLAFGKIRRLAEVKDSQLRINERGRRAGKLLERHPKRLAEVWRRDHKRH